MEENWKNDILEHMDSIEMDDWNRSSQIRDKWEKYLRSDGEEPAGKKKAPHKEEKPSPRKTWVRGKIVI